MPEERYLDLLLAHAGSRGPVLDGELAIVAGDSGAGQPVPEPLPPPANLWNLAADPNDLTEQRWGVIAPAGAEGDRLLALIEPLIARRQAQQGQGEVVRYRAWPKIASLADATRWKKSHVLRGDSLERPRYQLIVGDLDQVPLAVQQVLSTDGLVGRIAFDSDDGYRAYVDKVLRWEARSDLTRAGQAILGAVRDGTRATERGYQSLIQPGLGILRNRRAGGRLNRADIRDLSGRDLTPGEVLDAARMERPSVLCTVSHGEGPPPGGWPSPAEQRAEQGAMSFGPHGRIAAADVANGVFLPGGVWLMVACFSAGTPARSSYTHWLEALEGVGQIAPDKRALVLSSLALDGDRPFISALAKSALSNPDGPLAFIGHIDMAFSYSYREVGDRIAKRPGRFMNAIQAALEGARVGIGLHAIVRFFNEVNTELTALDDHRAAALSHSGAGSGVGEPTERERARRAHLWMLRQELAGYVLLGDPAARLPLAPGVAAQAPAGPDAEEPRPANVDVSGAGAAGAEPARIALPLPMKILETAIGKVLSAKFTLARVAHEHDLDIAELERLVDLYRRGGRAALGE